jgi:hypothetical protein
VPTARLQVAYCDDGEHEFNFMVAASMGNVDIFPVEESALWDEGGAVPDVLICTGWKFTEPVRELRERIKAKKLMNWKAAAAGAGYSGGLYWPPDPHRPSYLPGQLPLFVGVSHEPFSSGECKEWDIAIAAARPDVGSPSGRVIFKRCPTLYIPWGVASFWKRGRFSLQDLVAEPTSQKAVVKLAPAAPRKFAAFMVCIHIA